MILIYVFSLMLKGQLVALQELEETFHQIIRSRVLKNVWSLRPFGFYWNFVKNNYLHFLHFLIIWYAVDERFADGKVNGVEHFLDDNGFVHSMDQRAMDVKNVKKESGSTAVPCQNHIHSRLQYLESELSSVLSSLRSQKDTVVSLKVFNIFSACNGLLWGHNFIMISLMLNITRICSTFNIVF